MWLPISLKASSILRADPELNNEDGTVWVKITNTGTVPGKEAVLAYSEPKDGGQQKEFRSFGKTVLLEPGASQVLEIPVTGSSDLFSFIGSE